MDIGTLKPGESAGFALEMPEHVKKGDKVVLVFDWRCGACGEERQNEFEVKVGDDPPMLKIRCDCGTLWGKLRRKFL